MNNINICTISIDCRQYKTDQWEKEDALQIAEARILSTKYDKPDLFLLPEAFLTGLSDKALHNPANYETEGNSIYQRFSELARTHKAYIAVPMLTQNDSGHHNSVVLFDRTGDVVFTYHKAYPTPDEQNAGILSGTQTPECYNTDFGRICFAICFDLQFRSLFKHYNKLNAELLLFPTYFPGGFILRCLAFQFSFFAVSSHAQGEESIFIDNYGRETARANLFTPALTKTINLDSVVLPISHNLNKIESIKRKYGTNAIETEVHRPEGRLILRSIYDKPKIQDLISEFKLTTLSTIFSV